MAANRGESVEPQPPSDVHRLLRDVGLYSGPRGRRCTDAQLEKLNVAGSIPVARSTQGAMSTLVTCVSENAASYGVNFQWQQCDVISRCARAESWFLTSSGGTG